MKRFFHRIIFLFSIISISILILFLIIRISGHQIYFLNSTSMTPKFKYRSIIVADTHISPSEIIPEDVVIYRTSTNMLVMHRCISVDHLGHAVIKGDRNRSQAAVNLNTDLIGKVVFSFPLSL